MKIPFLKNTYVLRSLFLAYLATIGLVSIILIIVFISSGDADQLSSLILPMAGIYLFLFVLGFISAWIVMGNKYQLLYTLDQEGVLIEGTKDKGRNIKQLAIGAGVLTLNPGLVGAGLLVRENVIFIPWEDISNIEVESEYNRVVIHCSSWMKVALHYPVAIKDKLIKQLNTKVK